MILFSPGSLLFSGNLFCLIPVLSQKFSALAQNLKSSAVTMTAIHSAAVELGERTGEGA